jgi:hypothetical protein
MGVRTFSRLTNASSKKLENHCHRGSITYKLWSVEDIVVLIDADAPKSGPRGRYKKQN